MTDTSPPTVPRIDFQDLPPVLAERLRPRVERLGYLGEFFQVGALQPATLAAFIDFTEAAKDALPAATVELIALTAASTLRNDYERNQHQRLCLTLGISRKWIAEVEGLAPESANVLSREELAVQRFTLTALASSGSETTREFSELVRVIGPEPAVGVLFVLGRYLAHSLFIAALAIEPPVPSIWEEFA